MTNQDDETIDRMARAAFESDKASGNVAGGSTSRHTYDNIPEDKRWNYRRLVRAALAAVPPVAEQVSAPADPTELENARLQGRLEIARLRTALTDEEAEVDRLKAVLVTERDPIEPGSLAFQLRAALSESPVRGERRDVEIAANAVQIGDKVPSSGDLWRIVGRTGPGGTHVRLTAESSDGEWSSTRTLDANDLLHVVRDSPPVPAAEAAGKAKEVEKVARAIQHALEPPIGDFGPVIPQFLYESAAHAALDVLASPVPAAEATGDDDG